MNTKEVCYTVNFVNDKTVLIIWYARSVFKESWWKKQRTSRIDLGDLKKYLDQMKEYIPYAYPSNVGTKWKKEE